MTMWQLDLLDMILVGEKPIDYNQIGNRLYINMAWGDDLDEGEYIIIECYRKLNAEEYFIYANDDEEYPKGLFMASDKKSIFIYIFMIDKYQHIYLND